MCVTTNKCNIMSKPTPIKNAEALAGLIRAGRKDLGATQQRLADLHGMSRFTVVDAESGKGDPKLSTVMTLLSGLGLSIVAVPSHLAHRITIPQENAPESDEDVDLGDWDPGEEMTP